MSMAVKLFGVNRGVDPLVKPEDDKLTILAPLIVIIRLDRIIHMSMAVKLFGVNWGVDPPIKSGDCISSQIRFQTKGYNY